MSLAVNVMDVVDSRSLEITAAMEALKTNMGVSYKLSIPFHMRRRAASHNPKRLPARARPHDVEKSKVKFKWKHRSDKKLTSAGGDHEDKNEEDGEKTKKAKRLETHLWHAKRCHMADLWGYRLALHTTQKGERAAHRAINTSTTLRDTSFYHWCSLVGEDLPGKLTGVLVPNSCLVDRTTSCHLYHNSVCLGPVLVIWLSESCVYIRLHPAINHHTDLETVFSNLPGSSVGPDKQGVMFRSHTDSFSQFTVRGVRAMELLVKTLQLSDTTNSNVQEIWGELERDPYQYDLMKGVVLASKIVVPPPQHKNFVSVLDSQIKQPPKRLTPSNALCTDLLFSPEPRDLEDVTCQTRAEEFVTSCCIYRDPLTGSITLVLPRGTGTRIWIPLIYNGGRVIGMQDEHSLNTDAGVPTFPYDYPETPGGRSFLEQIGEEAKEKEMRRPPQKRVKYQELGILSPFISDWGAVLRDHSEGENACGGESEISVIRNPVQLYDAFNLSDEHDNNFITVSVSCEKRGNIRAGSHLYLPEDQITSHDTMSLGDPVYTPECNYRVIGYVTSGKYCLGSGKGGGLALILASVYKQIGDPGRLLARNTTSRQFRFVLVSHIR